MLYIWSRDVGWLAEASALLQTAMKFALVSVIPFWGLVPWKLTFSGGVIDTWSHRYSELLLGSYYD
jgi:hypothetical protein